MRSWMCMCVCVCKSISGFYHSFRLKWYNHISSTCNAFYDSNKCQNAWSLIIIIGWEKWDKSHGRREVRVRQSVLVLNQCILVGLMVENDLFKGEENNDKRFCWHTHTNTRNNKLIVLTRWGRLIPKMIRLWLDEKLCSICRCDCAISSPSQFSIIIHPSIHPPIHMHTPCDEDHEISFLKCNLSLSHTYISLLSTLAHSRALSL